MAATPDPPAVEADDPNDLAPAPPHDLLSIDDATAQARWEQLNEEELQQEIARYRTSLQSLAQDLASAGGAANGAGAHSDSQQQSLIYLAVHSLELGTQLCLCAWS